MHSATRPPIAGPGETAPGRLPPASTLRMIVAAMVATAGTIVAGMLVALLLPGRAFEVTGAGALAAMILLPAAGGAAGTIIARSWSGLFGMMSASGWAISSMFRDSSSDGYAATVFIVTASALAGAVLPRFFIRHREPDAKGWRAPTAVAALLCIVLGVLGYPSQADAATRGTDGKVVAAFGYGSRVITVVRMADAVQAVVVEGRGLRGWAKRETYPLPDACDGAQGRIMLDQPLRACWLFQARVIVSEAPRDARDAILTMQSGRVERRTVPPGRLFVIPIADAETRELPDDRTVYRIAYVDGDGRLMEARPNATDRHVLEEAFVRIDGPGTVDMYLLTGAEYATACDRPNPGVPWLTYMVSRTAGGTSAWATEAGPPRGLELETSVTSTDAPSIWQEDPAPAGCFPSR